jgi:hypothetical protein
MTTRLPRARISFAVAIAAVAIAAAGCSSPPHRVASYGEASSAPKLPALSSSNPQGATHASTSTSPSATPTLGAKPTPQSADPQSTQASAACVTSAQMGHCPFGPDSGITGATSDPYVDQNVWSPISGWQQTLYATSPGQWYVTANMQAGNTAVVSFPNTGFFYNESLSSFSSIISSFTDSIPEVNGTNAEATYDIWFNDDNIDEVMIQNDYSPGRSPSCDTWTATGVSFGGSNGVPVHPWDLCVNGSTAYWETANGNMPSGTIDVLAMLKWLVTNGELPAGVEMTGFSYGFEISSTGGMNENFSVSRFTAAAS